MTKITFQIFFCIILTVSWCCVSPINAEMRVTQNRKAVLESAYFAGKNNSRSPIILQLEEELNKTLKRLIKWDLKQKLVEEKKTPKALAFAHFAAIDTVRFISEQTTISIYELKPSLFQKIFENNESLEIENIKDFDLKSRIEAWAHPMSATYQSSIVFVSSHKSTRWLEAAQSHVARKEILQATKPIVLKLNDRARQENITNIDELAQISYKVGESYALFHLVNHQEYLGYLLKLAY